MTRENSDIPQLGSRLTRGEAVAALVYLPIHVALLPLLASALIVRGLADEATGNFICYAIGAVYMLIFLGRFLRRDFDGVCDRPFRVLLDVALSYVMMMGFNLCTALIISLVLGQEPENPNNAAIFNMAGENFGLISAMATFLAPIVEELIFRAGIFGLIRRYNRRLAYIFGILAFSVYHVWSYALIDPRMLIYIVQYLPISWLLCRIYERNDTVWAGIFLHMLINGISMRAVEMLGEML